MTIHERARQFFCRAHFLFFGCGILLLAALFSGCARQEPRADLTIINNAEPESLDPVVIVAQADMRVVSGMFEGLTRLEPVKAQAVPGLAQSWDISPDGKIYTFHLRTNLVWSTGEPITSADVVYSWIRALDPKTACRYAGQLYYLKNAEDFNTGKITNAALVGVSAPDKFTVRVELNSPTAFFLDLCAFPTLAVVPRQTIEKYGDRWLLARPLPVSGPYDLVAWRLNDKIRLKKNPLYWDATNTQTEIIDLLPVGSPNTALNLYERGQVDIVWDKELIPSELVDVLLKRPDFHSFSYLGTYFFRFNVTRKPFDDPRVRKALALAVDKERIVKKITRAGEVTTSHLVPTGTQNYDPPDGLGYDPELARKLLAEAGYPGGKGFPKVEFLTIPQETQQRIAEAFQERWRRELGVEVVIIQKEFKMFLAAINDLSRDYTFARGKWTAEYPDPLTFISIFTTGNGINGTGWTDPAYDALVNAANAELDPTKRHAGLQKAESYLLEHTPIAPVYWGTRTTLVQSSVRGWKKSPLGFHNYKDVWLEP
jgi:oligopeptide transport system substrate-binding protein